MIHLLIPQQLCLPLGPQYNSFSIQKLLQMANLVDNTFLTHVAVGTVLILGFMFFLFRGKASKKSIREDIELTRCKNIVDTIVQVIGESQSDNELNSYQGEADQFFTDNYDLLGYKHSMAFYNRMTQAVIRRRQQIKAKA